MSDDDDYDDGTEVGAYQAIFPPGTRAEKSLGLLTQKFLKLLQDAKDGIVDLNLVRKFV